MQYLCFNESCCLNDAPLRRVDHLTLRRPEAGEMLLNQSK
nr:MAG TPA_asm: hypothetical protein [Caudoviricetes sp.]